MILADTSIWVDHLRETDAVLDSELDSDNIAIHPYVIAELALGHLPRRQHTLVWLNQLPTVPTASSGEIRYLIEARKLYGRGIGFVDTHLLAAAYIGESVRLWTRDKKLRLAAEDLGVSAGIP